MPSPLELAYLAGLIDGEGCIMMRRDGRRRIHQYTLALVVTNEHKGTLEWCSSLFGGYIYDQSQTQQHHKKIYNWTINSTAAHAVLVAVIPYLQIKKDQAQLVIDHWASIRPGLASEIKTQDLAERRHFVWEKLRELKRKAYVQG